jgi:uncharacterized protein (TIGR01370 family)
MDIVDGYQNFENKKYNYVPSRKDMENFVIAISKRCKAKKPGFKIIVQNAEELAMLTDGRTPNLPYLNAVDGIGKESCFIMDGRKQPSTEIAWTVKYLNQFKSRGKLVFTTDYPSLSNYSLMLWCHQQADKYGYIEYCGPQNLNKIVLQPTY